MDMPMEIEDANQDKTKDILKNYLTGKINEIKLLSSASDTQKCQENCLEILQKSDNFQSSDLKISNTWQRVHNDKLIIGIHVENTTRRSAGNINIVLKNDLNVNLTYTTKLYTKYQPNVIEIFDEEVKPFVERMEKLAKNDLNIPIKDQWIPTPDLTSNSIIVIVLDIPQFVNFKSLNFEGVLLYEKRNKKFQTHLPKFCLTIEDVTSEKYTIKISSVLSGTDDAYLSMISASMHTPVKMIIPKGIYRTLDGLLQIDCFFTKAEVISRELILVYDGNSQCLKDIILNVSRHEKEPTVYIFTKNDKQLQLLYHHLYNKIPGLVILNKGCETITDRSELYSNQNTSFVQVKKPTESLIKFMDSFRTLLVFAEENFQNCFELKEEENSQIIVRNINLNKLTDGYENFRRNLADLEKRTDEHLKNAIDEK